MAQASEALSAPVVSGNVSLYNESQGEAIYPTPIIGALGLLDDVGLQVGAGFTRAGDAVVLLGAGEVAGRAEYLAGSEYLDLIHGLVAGRPSIDLDLEVRLQSACVRLIRDGVIRSAHDCSDGGLAVAIAECCILGGLGFDGEFEVGGRWDAALFGEAQSRIVVSLSPDLVSVLGEVCDVEGVPWVALGRTGGGSLRVGGDVDLKLESVDDAWRNALERAITRDGFPPPRE